MRIDKDLLLINNEVCLIAILNIKIYVSHMHGNLYFILLVIPHRTM